MISLLFVAFCKRSLAAALTNQSSCRYTLVSVSSALGLPAEVVLLESKMCLVRPGAPSSVIAPSSDALCSQ